MTCKLVIFGVSNILSDIFDCARANGIGIARIVQHLPASDAARDVPLAQRIAALRALGEAPETLDLDSFAPRAGELYILGPTTPSRTVLAQLVAERFGVAFTTLVHPTAYVSPLATLGPGCFIGANSVVAPGARLGEHVFVNRGVTIGHDTVIGAFSRIQPGSNVGGLSHLGSGVTLGIGTTLIERLVIGDNAFVAAGAVVIADVAADVMVAGSPARVSRSLAMRA